jgi:hypothetical protein
VSGIQAARVAARLRRELGADVDMLHGRYGEFKVLVDDAVVVDAGKLAMLGVLPSTGRVLEAVRTRLGSGPARSQ